MDRKQSTRPGPKPTPRIHTIDDLVAEFAEENYRNKPRRNWLLADHQWFVGDLREYAEHRGLDPDQFEGLDPDQNPERHPFSDDERAMYDKAVQMLNEIITQTNMRDMPKLFHALLDHVYDVADDDCEGLPFASRNAHVTSAIVGLLPDALAAMLKPYVDSVRRQKCIKHGQVSNALQFDLEVGGVAAEINERIEHIHSHDTLYDWIMMYRCFAVVIELAALQLPPG